MRSVEVLKEEVDFWRENNKDEQELRNIYSAVSSLWRKQGGVAVAPPDSYSPANVMLHVVARPRFRKAKSTPFGRDKCSFR